MQYRKTKENVREALHLLSTTNSLERAMWELTTLPPGDTLKDLKIANLNVAEAVTRLEASREDWSKLGITPDRNQVRQDLVILHGHLNTHF